MPGDRDDVADIYRLKDGKAARISKERTGSVPGQYPVRLDLDDGREVAFTTNYPFDRADRDEGARDSTSGSRRRGAWSPPAPASWANCRSTFVKSGMVAASPSHPTTRRSMLPADQDRQTDIHRISRDGKFKLITN